jgi:hypothetical protein
MPACDAATVPGARGAPVVVQLNDAREEVRYNLRHEHCNAAQTASVAKAHYGCCGRAGCSPPSLKSRAMFFFGRDSGMSSTCEAAAAASHAARAQRGAHRLRYRVARSPQCAPTGTSRAAPPPQGPSRQAQASAACSHTTMRSRVAGCHAQAHVASCTHTRVPSSAGTACLKEGRAIARGGGARRRGGRAFEVRMGASRPHEPHGRTPRPGRPCICINTTRCAHHSAQRHWHACCR